MLNELRFAIRGLARTPGFTAVAVITLALGIGATTAVFTLVDSVLLRALPYPDSDRIVSIRHEGRGGEDELPISTGLYLLYREHARSISSIALQGNAVMNITGENDAERVAGAVVTPSIHDVLRVNPVQGRRLMESDGETGADPVVILSHAYWQSRFGGDASVLNTTLLMNGVSRQIVGIMPPGFAYPDEEARFWIPLTVDPANAPLAAFGAEGIARMADGTTLEAVRADVAGIIDRLEVLAADDAATVSFLREVRIASVVDTLKNVVVGNVSRVMWTLLGMVAFVLLIACANVANLLLSRGIARQAELAMRRALGATRARLLQQQLAEGAVLSLAGAVLGVGVAVLFGELFRTGSVAGLPVLEEFTIDGRVIAFALCAALGTSLFFTLIPALAGRRARSGLALRAGGRSAGDAGAGLRSALTVVQVAASLALLVGALMLVQTVRNLHGIERGYEPDAVLAYGFTPSPQGYGSQAARTLRRRLLEEVALLPGIRSASVASALPVPDDRFMSRLSVPGREADPLVVATFDVSAAYFTTLGTRIVAGRAFTPAEQHQPLSETPGVILSAAAARELFGTADPLNRVVEIRGFTGTTLQPVLGIAEDVRMAARDEVMPVMYQPLGAAALPHGYLLVQSNLGPAQTQQMVTGALARLDPAIPLFQSESLADALRHAIAAERLLAVALGLFAALAVTLAAIGLYGVIAYSVARRRSEIGIRMAIGAPRLAIVRLIAMRSFRLLGIGVLAGSVAAYALGRLLESRIYGVSPVEPSLYLAAIVFFVAVTALASALPARAATRIDPARALRPQ